MANYKGVKWNKGGKMRRNKLALQISGLDELVEKMEEVGLNVEKVISEVMENAGEDVAVRTKEAMDKSDLPAGGKYSRPETINTIVMNPKTQWHGSIAEIGVGFDKTKNGVGSLLITGTPRMRPDYALEKIYVNKKHMNQLSKQMGNDITDFIIEKMEE